MKPGGSFVLLATLVMVTSCGGSSDDNGTDASVADGSGSDAQGLNATCNSLLAARILELQQEGDATFPADCDTPLRDGVGTIDTTAATLCAAGESANACRDRLYTTPPDIISSLRPGLPRRHDPAIERIARAVRAAIEPHPVVADERVSVAPPTCRRWPTPRPSLSWRARTPRCG